MTYSSSLAMNRTRFSGRNQNSVSFRTETHRLGPVSNTIILIVLACLLGFAYLTQVTKTNAYGYQINGLQQQQSQLSTENQNLQVAAARLESLSKVQDSAVVKNMVPITPSGTITN